ncbi:MAG: 3-dehydroquinate synthase [Candidatus Gracilibacteria bacterium]
MWLTRVSSSHFLKLLNWRDDSYEIQIEPGLFQKIPADLKDQEFGEKYCIVTDTNTRKFYGERLLKALHEAGLEASMISFQSGEGRKTLETIGKLAEQMVQLGHHRTSCVIALGGGVVGDIGGFLASIFMRGIPFVHVPTTLLAMGDSAIGGKTGVDLRIGKNLVGTTAQPQKVYVDPALLATLPKKQIQNGLAEIIKHGLIADRKIYKILKKFPNEAGNANTLLLTKLLIRSCKVKTRIVEKDERETGVRMLLNYGHTIGHAIEYASGYRLSHGQAIAIGMNLENRLAVDLKLQSPKTCEQIEQVLRSLGLPTRLPDKLEREPILKAIRRDKKHTAHGFTFVLLKRPGKPKIIRGITEDQVRAIL